MPLEHSSNWVDAPGCKTIFQEGKAGILQVRANKKFSPTHSFELLISQITLYESCLPSSKTLPVVIQTWEEIDNEKFIDIYSFDRNGICLSHGYSRYVGGKRTVDEEHDTDITRLIKNKGVIGELIRDYPVDSRLLMNTTYLDLAEGCLEERN